MADLLYSPDAGSIWENTMSENDDVVKKTEKYRALAEATAHYIAGFDGDLTARAAPDLASRRDRVEDLLRDLGVYPPAGIAVGFQEYEDMLKLAREKVFGTTELARQWLEKPAMVLDNQKPYDLLFTPEGRERVETVLMQMHYGTYI